MLRLYARQYDRPDADALYIEERAGARGARVRAASVRASRRVHAKVFFMVWGTLIAGWLGWMTFVIVTNSGGGLWRNPVN